MLSTVPLERRREVVRVGAKKKWVAMLVSVFALCLVLAGCTAGGDATKNFVGDWKLVGMEENGETTSPEDIQLMEGLGMTVTLSVKEDKTFVLNVFGDETSGSWEAKNPSEASLTVDGQTVSATLANGVLTMEQDGAKLSFEKGTPSTGSGGDSTTSGGSEGVTGTDTGTTAVGAPSGGDTAGITTTDGGGEAAIPIGQTIADDDICTIEVVDKKADWAGDSGYTLRITNKSDKKLRVFASYGSFSVDGKMVDPVLSELVLPGKYSETFMWFDSSDVASVDDLVNVEGTFEVDDDDTYDTLAEYPFAM